MKRKKTYRERYPVNPEIAAYVEVGIADKVATMTSQSRAEAIANARKRREEAEERERMSLGDCMEAILQAGERATGLTREQLRAKWFELDKEPPPVRVDSRPSRDVLVRRGIPETHLAHVYDREPEECDALTQVRMFLDSDQQQFLVLSGAPGTRKTGSACWALTREPGMFVAAKDIASIAANSSVTERMYQLRTAPLLVLDDVGVQYVDEKGYFYTAFNALIDERYAAALKTILTTNLSPVQFRDRYEERIARRIRECGKWFAIAGGA